MVKWNRVAFKLTAYGFKNGDEMVANFSTKVSGVRKDIIMRVAKLFVKRAKIRHTAAWAQWRRGCSSARNKLSATSRDQLDDIILGSLAYLRKMHRLAEDVLSKYHENSPLGILQSETVFELDRLLAVFTSEENPTVEKPHLINSLEEVGFPLLRFEYDSLTP